ncbi:MAG: SMC-Scp complex subunit ScpB [Spirochaetaceae bacterium]|nr:SMC-Scp complex subunit ScpB [Spirochaetaceae bacterium]
MSPDDRISRQAGGDAVAVRDPRVPVPPGRSPNGVHLEVSAPANGSGNGHGRTTPVDVAPAAAKQEDAAAERDGSNGCHLPAGSAPVVEAALLLEGHPATPARLARITGLPVREIEHALTMLRQRYAAPEFGLQVARVADSYSLMPKAELWERLRHHYGTDSGRKLSRAAMETLTIVAYSQPVTRSQIEAMRGVSADAMIRLLNDRQLIRAVGYKEDSVGRPTLFGTTNRFLESFGLETIDDLPKLDEVEESRFRRT